MSEEEVHEAVAGALRSLGETVHWRQLPRALHQHKCARFKAFVNVWPTRGTVLVQGGEAPALEKVLKELLGEEPNLHTEPNPEPSIEQDAWHLFVDGSCPANRQVGKTTAAGWGVAVYQQQSGERSIFAELFGPVVTDLASPLSLGATCGSNNTGELSAMAEACLWLLDQSLLYPAVLHYDSEYAANIALGRNKAHKNVELAEKLQMLLAQVQAQRRVRLCHVKGHSGCPGNEHADQLAATGARGSFSCPRWARHMAAEQAAQPPEVCPIFENLGRGPLDSAKRRPPTPATGGFAKKLRGPVEVILLD
ncbi:unnamed protein product [Effrenium voratum]|uniref:RNase H type-1 domain-containing protein n=1 Tax=Effrenium voratum TaxID=2562239 RepID=A0AA36MLP7_9DINO|nr:unnamed protein product [Effrenium voratum]